MGPNEHRMICNEAMQRFHEVLDGDLMDVAVRTRMESHLATCPECSEKAAQLREMQDLLRGFAEAPLPDEGLQGVWDRTVASTAAPESRRFDWRFAAAAAAVLFVAWVGVTGWRMNTPEETQHAEALQAAEETRMVLQLAANALKRTERAAFKEVFTDEISPALRKVGVKWPQAPERAGGKGADL